MDRKECPKWVCEIGWRVDELVQEPKNRDRFRKVLRKWYNDNAHKSEYRLLPLEPREHRLREMYVVCAAIHDCCCREVKPIHPWSKLPLLSTVGTKYFGLMGDVPMLLTQKKDNLALESFLESVNRDLPVKIELAETEQGIENIGHMDKKQDAASEVCSEDEFRQFTSIYKRLTALRKEFYKPIEKRSDGFSLRRIDIDEDISTFWRTMKKIGQKVGVDLPGTPALIKAIIYEEEITSPYPDLAEYFGTGCYIDGKYVDEIELAEMAKEDIEERENPRYELIENIDKIMVRLCKHFDVQPYEDQGRPQARANSWKEVAIEVIDKDTIKYKVRDGRWIRTNYTELGFLDKRKNQDNKLWPIFLGLATKNLPPNINKPGMKSKDIDRIRDTLRKFFSIKSRPIEYDKRAKEYRCNFNFNDPRDWTSTMQNENLAE